jgi:hypothetical protein
MVATFQPIYTQTVGSGGATQVNFNNIPQSFSDLKIVVSSRESAISDFRQPLFLNINGNTYSGYSDTILLGNSNSASATRNSYGAGTRVMIGYASGVTATSNTFAIVETYIPGYTSSNYKQIITEGVSENANSSSYMLNISGILYQSTLPITSLQLTTYTTFAQNSTFTLYGIKSL